VLQPIILALLIVLLALWCMIPGGFRKRGLDEAQAKREAGVETTELQTFQSFREGVRALRRKVGILKA